MNVTRTIEHARRLGAGAILCSPDGAKYRVSDWSPATGSVFGYPVNAHGMSGPYTKLPDNCEPLERAQ